MGCKSWLTVAVAAAVLVAFACPAWADDPGLSSEYSTCMDRSGGVTVKMIDCISAEMKRQDARLNKAYKELRAQLSPQRKNGLRDVQRLWIKYRDANCGFHADPDGGSYARVMGNKCMLRMTAARAKELEDLKMP